MISENVLMYDDPVRKVINVDIWNNIIRMAIWKKVIADE